MSQKYEVEIKSLLGSAENAERLRKKLKEYDPHIRKIGSHSQLNHYFNSPKDLDSLEENLLKLVPEKKHDELKKVVREAKNHSIRTRDADGKVLIVIKASIGDDSSANGVRRIEFEQEVDMTIDELDRVLLDSGLSWQAKWSREREEYRTKDIYITIDKNAGYGYLAEFEIEVKEENAVGNAEERIRKLMDILELEELPQDRLERMFEFYNANWHDYYGTDKTFTIE